MRLPELQSLPALPTLLKLPTLVGMSSPQWIIRSVSRDDEAAWRQLYRGYRAFYLMPENEAAIDTVWGWLHDQTHESRGYVAVSDDGVIGAIAHVRYFARPLSATTGLFLDDLFTDPRLRGQGLGGRMLEFLSVHAAETGCSVVRWVTAEDNATARALYDATANATRWVTYDMAPRVVMVDPLAD